MTDSRIRSTLGDTEPVLLPEAKNYLRLGTTPTADDDLLGIAEDTLITAMIVNARMRCEGFLNSDILAKERTLYLTTANEPFNLPYAPLNITRDGDDLLTNFTITVDDVAQVEGDTFEILGLDNPSIRLNTQIEAFGRGGNRGDFSPAQKVSIDYVTAGIDSSMVKQGVLACIAELYYGRDAKMPSNWRAFLSPFKTFGFYGIR